MTSNKKEIILHIGHGKTGTSALQSFLAINSHELKKNNIYYPEAASFNAAKKGLITSGNIPIKDKLWVDHIINKAQTSPCNKTLFSNESLIHSILKYPEELKKLNDTFDITLIMYIRNPLEHIFSSYGQTVKRQGQTESISSWIENYTVLDRVIKVINTAKKLDLRLKVINYSNTKSIEESFINEALELNDSDILRKSKWPARKRINRSLSRVEYEIQRRFNKHLGKSSSTFISDPLVNYAPEIESEKEFIEPERLKSFLAINKEKIAEINNYVDKKNKLSLKTPRQKKQPNHRYEITAKQIDIIAESISQEIKNSSKKIKPQLEDEDANILRDIALKIEKNKTTTLEDAYYLMSLAHKARPKGNFIKNKLIYLAKKINK